MIKMLIIQYSAMRKNLTSELEGEKEWIVLPKIMSPLSLLHCVPPKKQKISIRDKHLELWIPGQVSKERWKNFPCPNLVK